MEAPELTGLAVERLGFEGRILMVQGMKREVMADLIVGLLTRIFLETSGPDVGREVIRRFTERAQLTAGLSRGKAGPAS